MTNEEIRNYLEKHAENKMKEFNASLILDTDTILGVRVPEVRKLAQRIAKEDWRSYLKNARDDSYEEILLQGFVIGYAKAEIQEILDYAKNFIPKIHDWAVNDGFCSNFKIAKKHPKEVWEFMMQYRDSNGEFEQRVVAVMLMSYFLVDDYIDKVFEVWDGLDHEGYYCKMGIAWGVATAYAKYPKKTHAYLLQNHLDDFTYNKSIQKMIESNRITEEQKMILRSMKREKGKL